MFSRRDQPRDMSYIHHQHRAAGICRLPELREIYGPCIRRSACHYEFRLALLSYAPHLIIINEALVIYSVRHAVEILAAEIYR